MRTWQINTDSDPWTICRSGNPLNLPVPRSILILAILIRYNFFTTIMEQL